ncbi:MAG: hypothetical protein V1720_22750 [bacterium]
MRYTAEIQRMQTDPHYAAAQELFKNIVYREVPDYLLIKTLYGPSRAGVILADIEYFYESAPLNYKKPRKHLPDSPEEISYKRSKTEKNKTFQSIQSSLLHNQLPDINILQAYYGEYAMSVHDVFKKYLELGLKRKCGISATCHFNRVGAVVNALQLDDGESHQYQTIGALHDAIEDLLFLVTDDKGRPYNFDTYDDFINRYIPFELAEAVKLLTNHFDLILFYAAKQIRRNDRALTKANLLSELRFLKQIKCDGLKKYIEDTSELLSKEEPGVDLLESAKWLCYKKLYITEMARLTHNKSNYRPFEIKAVDLSDNGHGKDALPMSSRIKNIIKQCIWAREGYALKSTWKPLNDRIMEIQEDALVHAEHIIIKDLLEQQSSQDFIVAALLKFKELELVFYE